MSDYYEELLKKLQDPEIAERLKKAKTMKELTGENGVFSLLLKSSLENIMKAEIEDHLGYSPNDRKNKNTENSRNGYYKKNVKSAQGTLDIEVPRDRDGSYEPQVVPKFIGINTELEENIISMYAKGMTTRDISEHLKRAYAGVDISPTLISKVTDKVLDHVTEWQARPLEEVYPIIFLDAIHYKVKSENKILSKAAYVVLGVNNAGLKDILGIYIGESESSSFWLSVLTDLNNRGVRDILIACIDGLKGFPQAIEAIFPKTEIQLCIIHQIRNSLRYVGSSNQREFMNDLKTVYQATTIELAEKNLKSLTDKWGSKYPVVTNSWVNNWHRLSTYFKYSTEIRKLIYTTNVIENFHRQLRKVTKNRSVFTSDDALMKLLYLATKDVSRKWTNTKWNWTQCLSQLAIHFEGRLKLDIL